MVSKEKGMVGAIGTVTGESTDLFLNGAKPSPIAYGADLEVIDPIGETARQLPTDYFKAMGESDITPEGTTKREFVESLPWWARPAFRESNVYLGLVGPLHAAQIAELRSKQAKASKPKELNYSVAEIDAIIGDTGYEPPSTPEDFGPNFKLWLDKNKEMLAKNKDWDGILTAHGLEPTVQYGLGAPVQKRTFEQYRAECGA